MFEKRIVVCWSLHSKAVVDEDPESEVVVLRHVHHQPPPLVHPSHASPPSHLGLSPAIVCSGVTSYVWPSLDWVESPKS